MPHAGGPFSTATTSDPLCTHQRIWENCPEALWWPEWRWPGTQQVAGSWVPPAVWPCLCHTHCTSPRPHATRAYKTSLRITGGLSQAQASKQSTVTAAPTTLHTFHTVTSVFAGTFEARFSVFDLSRVTWNPEFIGAASQPPLSFSSIDIPHDPCTSHRSSEGTCSVPLCPSPRVPWLSGPLSTFCRY